MGYNPYFCDDNWSCWINLKHCISKTLNLIWKTYAILWNLAVRDFVCWRLHKMKYSQIMHYHRHLSTQYTYVTGEQNASHLCSGWGSNPRPPHVNPKLYHVADSGVHMLDFCCSSVSVCWSCCWVLILFHFSTESWVLCLLFWCIDALVPSCGPNNFYVYEPQRNLGRGLCASKPVFNPPQVLTVSKAVLLLLCILIVIVHPLSYCSFLLGLPGTERAVMLAFHWCWFINTWVCSFPILVSGSRFEFRLYRSLTNVFLSTHGVKPNSA